MTIPFNLPHLGSTGVIQDPGTGGAIAGAFSALPQILQANQQLEMERARAAENTAYIRAQMEHMERLAAQQANAAALQAQQDEAVGGFIQAITAPRQTTVNPGGAAGLQPFTAPVDPVPVGDALARVDPRFVGEAVKQGEKQIKAREELAATRETERRTANALRGLSPTMANAARRSADLRDLPAGARERVFNDLAGISAQITPDKLNAMISFAKAGGSMADAANALGVQLPEGMESFVPKDEGDWMARLVTTLALQNQMGQMSEGEASMALKWRGAQREMDNIDVLLAGGYKPGEDEFSFSPLLPHALRRAAIRTEEGKQFFDSAFQVAFMRAFALSGSNVPDKEIEVAAQIALRSLFDGPGSMDVKVRRLRGWVEDLRLAARRGAERFGDPAGIGGVDPATARARQLQENRTP